MMRVTWIGLGAGAVDRESHGDGRPAEVTGALGGVVRTTGAATVGRIGLTDEGDCGAAVSCGPVRVRAKATAAAATATTAPPPTAIRSGDEPARIHSGRCGNAGKGRVSQAHFVAQTSWDASGKAGTAAEDGIEHLKSVIVRVPSLDTEMPQIDIELLGRHRNIPGAPLRLPNQRSTR